LTASQGVWLIPLIAIAGAIVNAGTNLWSLAEVRGSLGIAPSVRKYVALVPPTVTMFAAVLLLQHFMPRTWPGWVVILAALTTGYLVFAAASFLSLDADDRVIARMIRSRVRGLASAKLGDTFS